MTRFFDTYIPCFSMNHSLKQLKQRMRSRTRSLSYQAPTSFNGPLAESECNLRSRPCYPEPSLLSMQCHRPVPFKWTTRYKRECNSARLCDWRGSAGLSMNHSLKGRMQPHAAIRCGLVARLSMNHSLKERMQPLWKRLIPLGFRVPDCRDSPQAFQLREIQPGLRKSQDQRIGPGQP
jgi:hypothetical protein